MNIAHDLMRFHLHDGSLLNIEYAPEQKKLSFEIELCDWAEEDAEPDDVFGKRGIFTFYDVEDFKTNIPLPKIDFTFIDILDFEHNADLDNSTHQGVEALLQVGFLANCDILQIQFKATHFNWIELGDVDRY